MKKVILAVLAAAAVISAQYCFTAKDVLADTAGAKVTVYYFHGSFRCPTCHKLEQYAKEAVETNFKDAIGSGALEYKTVNVEDKGNEHFTNDYQLYTKSVVLSMTKDGKETKWKNLDKIWDLVRDKQKYMEYVKSEVNNFLKE